MRGTVVMCQNYYLEVLSGFLVNFLSKLLFDDLSEALCDGLSEVFQRILYLLSEQLFWETAVSADASSLYEDGISVSPRI
mgnify:CR=1